MTDNECTAAVAPAFDESMSELELIVSRLEGGELPLEAALQTFERGIALVRVLSQRLSEAEGRVEMLTRNARGELSLEPLDRDSNGE